MKKILFAAMSVVVLITSLAFAGQDTGGDKARLNPQPLPPGRHAQYRRTHRHKHRRKHRRSAAYQPQWGGRRNTAGVTNSKPK